jgi:hypothetical protein
MPRDLQISFTVPAISSPSSSLSREHGPEMSASVPLPIVKSQRPSPEGSSTRTGVKSAIFLVSLIFDHLLIWVVTPDPSGGKTALRMTAFAFGGETASG